MITKTESLNRTFRYHKIAKYTAIYLLPFGFVSIPAAQAVSATLLPNQGVAVDILTSDSLSDPLNFTSFAQLPGGSVGWTNAGLRFHDAGGILRNVYGTPPDYWNGGFPDSGVFHSFTRVNPAGTSAWVGFTTLGNVDDRIYEVDLATGAWTQRATLAGNFDLRFSGDDILVAGATFGSPNSIFKLDTSVTDNHDKLLELVGPSAGFDIGPDGALYYGSFGLDADLRRFSADVLDMGLGAGFKTAADGELLAILDAGASSGGSGLEVDTAGNVFLTVNDFSGFPTPDALLLQWNGIIGSDFNFDVLAEGVGFLSGLTSEGDILAGDPLFVLGAGPGITEYSIPEPSVFAFCVGITALVFAFWIRKRPSVLNR